MKCGYLPADEGRAVHLLYDEIIGKLVTMENNPRPWLLQKSKAPESR